MTALGVPRAGVESAEMAPPESVTSTPAVSSEKTGVSEKVLVPPIV